jgi:molybdopterin-guanine dinucleotide biosynthesis protein
MAGMKLSIVVQAGGESRRMGRDKGLVPFLGQPLIQRIVDRVKPIADELLITSNHPEDYTSIGYPVYPDVLPERSALSGIYTAFFVAKYPLVAVVACDMAFVSSDLLALEREYLLENKADGVVPHTGLGYEPFHAVYRREACLAAVKTALDHGQKRADAWFPTVKVVRIPAKLQILADPYGEAFINLNTPEELRRAELQAGNATYMRSSERAES